MSIHATSTEVYSGKNLYDQTTPQSGTWGITYSGNANFFEVNGNPTGTGGRAFIGTSTLPAGTYTLTLEYLSGEGNINVYGYEGTSWTQPFSSRLDVNSSTRVATKTFTLESQTNVRLAVYTYSGNNCTNLRGRFQIEAGSRSTSFEPYVGGVPSPLISGVTHVSTSKNLLNMQSDSNGEYFGTMSQHGITWKNLYTGSPSFSGYGNVSGWEDGGTYNGMPVIKKTGSWGGAYMLVNIVAGKTYTFSAWIKSDQARGVAFYAKGGSTGATADISPLSESITTSTNWERVSFTFTCTTSGSVGMRLENISSSTTNYTYISGYQLEEGSTATSFEPYLGSGIYSGKNLMIYPYSTRAPFTNGITFTSNSDGTVVLNGQNDNAGNSAFFFYSNSPGTFTLPAGTYYFLRPSDTSIQFVTYDGTTYWNFNAGNNYSRTFNSSMTFQDIYVQVPRGNTTVFNGLKVYPMLSTLPNQTQDDYEPYVGGVPSPNPDYPQEIVVGKLASKNIFEASSSPAEVWQGDYTKITANSLKVKSTVNHPSSTAYARVDITGLTPNTDYYFSYNYERTGGSVSGPTVGGVATRIDGGAISSVTIGGRKINTGPGTYIRFYFYVGQNTSITTSDEVTFSNIQLEKGSTATEFEPYFTPIELTQVGNYQDKVYKSGGNWYVERSINGMKLDSSTNFIPYTVVSDTGFTFFKATVATPKGQQCISNYFTTSYTGWSELQNQHIEMLQVYTNDSLYLKTKTSRISSAEALNTWLSNRDVRAYYILATPTTTAIADSATTAWLNKYDTNTLPHHKYVNTRRTTYVGASGLASAIDLYDGSYASTLPTYSTANDHHLTTANGGTYTVSLQNISAKIVSGTVTFSVFTNQRKIDFSWNGSATSTNVSVSLQADEYIKSIYAYIPQNADAGITLSQQLESGSLTDFEPYYNIVKIYAGDDLVFEDTSLTD